MSNHGVRAVSRQSPIFFRISSVFTLFSPATTWFVAYNVDFPAPFTPAKISYFFTKISPAQ